MACKYYLNGVESKLYTDLFGYMDTVAPDNKNVNKVHKILRDHSIATKKFKNTIYVQQNNFRSALRDIKRINNKYPGLISTEYVKMTPQTIYSPAAELHVLTINEDLLKRIPAEGTNNADITSDNKTDVDQYLRFAAPAAERDDAFLDDLARRENTSNSKFSNLETEELKNAYKVAGELQESFAKAGINVNVVFDASIDNIGQVQIEADEVAFEDDGTPVQTGTPTIRINPEKVKKDTTYHEFGHIYIDLLGVSDPVVAQAIAELRDTELYNQVEQAYPELQGEMLDKEVLATAIGLEGAKIVRKNPNKLQRLFNKLFRAIGKLFGVSPNTAAVLAEEMFAGKLRSEGMINRLSPYVQASKEEVKLKELVDNARVRITQEIYEINKLPEDQVSDDQLTTLRRLENSLQRVTKVEDLFDLVDAMGDALNRTEVAYANIMAIPENERGTSENLRKMWELKKQLDSLEMLQSVKSLLITKKRNAFKKDTSFMNEMESFEAFTTLEDKVNAILTQAESLDQDFKEDVIPMLAQSMIGLSNKDLPADIQKLIDNAKKFTRSKGLDESDLAYIELKGRYNKGELTDQEFKLKKSKLYIEQLKQKQLKNYKDLVSELTTAHKDKSGYSYYFDPIIYSSDRGIQLLVKTVTQANLESNDMTLDLKSKLAPMYERFAAGQNESNVEELNDPVLEEITIGGMKRLALVNPIDSERYYKELTEEKNRLGKKHGIPRKQDYTNSEGDVNYASFNRDLDSWGNSESKGGRYRKELSKWTDKNLEAIPGYKQELAKLDKEIKIQADIINALKNEGVGKSEALSNARIRKNELEKFRNRNYINEKPAGDFLRPKASVYANEKYTKIQNDPRLKEYYDFIIQEFQAAQRMIGLKQMEKNGWDKYSYLMPTYRKEDIDRLKEKGVYNTIQDTLKDGFTIQETNHDYYTYNENNRDIEKKIPIYAVNKVPSGEVSRDVASSLYRFRHMAHNFKSKSEIVGQVMFFQDLLKNRKTLETNSAGIQLIQKAAKQMGIDMPKLKEGESNNYKHVQEWLDSVMFGQSNLQQDFTIFGKTFSANEAVGTINSFTAISTLSFNLLQGANQSILDNLMMLQESIAGQFMDKGDLAWAKGEYWSSGMAVTDIGRFDPKSKIGKAVEFFDALTEFTDSEGNQIVGGKSRKLAKSGNLLFLQQAAEHELSATRMLALMKNLEGKLEDSDGNVIMNEDGKPANLYDMLIVDDNGKMSVDPRVANFSRLDFIMKLQGLSRRTNQIKSKMHTNMLQRRWWGKLFMLFRNWMPPGIRRRYGHGGNSTIHVDEELGAVTQGMYISFWNLITESISDKSFAYGRMTEMEQQNVKRTAVELSSLMGAMLLVGFLADLDDEDETWLSNFALYQAKRYETEIMQWTPLVGTKEAFRILQSPTATARPILKGGELLGQLFSEGAYAIGLGDKKEVFYQRKSGKYQKGDRKIRKDFEDLFPIFRGLQKSRNPQDAYKWFTTLD